MFIKNVRGFSIIEILVLGTVVSIISLGTLKLLNISIQSAQVSNATFTEEELIKSIRKGVAKESTCRFNLYYKKLNGNQNQGKGTISELKTPDNIVLLKEGTIFKNNLDIVKMQLDGNQPLTVSGPAVERFFTVYYKKINMGKLNTLGGGTCTPSNFSGCYFQSYKVMYQLKQIFGQPDYALATCSLSHCTQGACCYSADDYDETLPEDDISAKDKGRTLIGCRGASGIQHSRTVSLGFATGEKNTDGFSNIFIGYRAGRGNTTGSKNTIIGAAIKTPGTITGSSNIFIGYEAGVNNTKGEKNTFIGMNTGLENTEGENNTFIGMQAGMEGTTLEENIFIGYLAGEKTGTVTSGTPPIVKGNVFLGYGSGVGDNYTHNNTGEFNTFMGYASGRKNTEGNHNIYVGYNVGPKTPPQADIRQDSHQQFNLGNLILGRIPDPNSIPHPLQDSPDIPPGNGVVINGNLIVKGDIGYNCHPSPCVSLPPIPSSKVYKKNIKPFKNFKKALKDIVDTPLFTYEYKKDRPKKSRMGIISEELPKHLQIKDLDSGLRRNDKTSRNDDESGNDKLSRNDGAKGKSSAKKKPSMPDWPSVYGTFWASIKTLFLQFKSFKETVLAELKEIKEQFISTLKIIKENKTTLTSFNKQIQKTMRVSQINKKENSWQKKELVQINDLLKKAKVELEANRRELHQIRNIVQKGVK